MNKSSEVKARTKLEFAWKKYESRISVVRRKLRRLFSLLDQRQSTEKTEDIRKKIIRI